MNGNSLYYAIAKKLGVPTSQLVLAVRCLFEVLAQYKSRNVVVKNKTVFFTVRKKRL